MALHADQHQLNRNVGQAIRLAGQMNLLTDTTVQNATNVTDLKASIDTAAAAQHADAGRNWAFTIKRALDVGYDDGTLTDAAVAAATGVDNLASLTLSTPGKVGPGIE